jgi:hypothetical protein
MTTCAWPSRTSSTPTWSTADYGNVVDAVVLWWRDEDGDLVDGLVDALTDLVGGGAIWLLTPKVGRRTPSTRPTSRRPRRSPAWRRRRPLR